LENVVDVDVNSKHGAFFMLIFEDACANHRYFEDVLVWFLKFVFEIEEFRGASVE
jgi:hypothetical protein